MAPASRPAESWSEASVGPCSVTTGTLNRSGRAPYLRLLARDSALAWVKLPLISAWPLLMMPFTVGAEMTLPSRTIANCFCWPVSWLFWFAICWVTLAKTFRALLLNVRLTVHCTFCWFGGVAAALFRSVPSMSADDRSSLSPFSSQVSSGSLGLSLTGGSDFPAAGQVNLLNFCSHALPGLSCHLSGSPTGAPAAVAPDAPAAAEGTALGSALSGAVGVAVAWPLEDAFGDAFGLAVAVPLSAARSPEESARPLGLAEPCGLAVSVPLGDAEPSGEAEPLGEAAPLGDPEP